tara:strand:- start:8910 stop:9257 length:348 start_codon:yes stop_codon:yes gene_type:complete
MNLIDFFYNLYEKIYYFFYKDYKYNFDIYTEENIKLINKYIEIDVKKYNLEELKLMFNNEIGNIESNNKDKAIGTYDIHDIEKITILRDQLNNINNILREEEMKQDILLEIINDN